MLDSSGHDGGVSHAKSDGLMKDHAKSGSLDDHVSLTAEARYDFCVNASSCIDGASSNSQGSLPVNHRASNSSLDDMMLLIVINCCILMVALVILHVAGADLSLFSIIMGQHYSLPGGSIGRKYNDLSCEEL